MALFTPGDNVRDIITEVEGTITGHVEYMTGCDQYLVQPNAAEDKKKEVKPDTIWFDENSLEKIGENTKAKAIWLKNKEEVKGPDSPAPTK